MTILGISAGFHDAAATVLDQQGNILFAAHSERYSKRKHDSEIAASLVDVLKNDFEVESLAYYERPWVKNLRQLRAGQRFLFQNWTVKSCLQSQLGSLKSWPKVKNYQGFQHHLCHAAAGFQTSKFARATVVVIDAIGEFETASIWAATYDHRGHATYKKLWQQNYPHSIGLFYSAITQRLGLQPLDEEYITMGMAAWGDGTKWLQYVSDSVVKSYEKMEFTDNFHIGLPDTFLYGAKDEDIAAAAQLVTERLIQQVMAKAQQFNWSTNLVYMGGVALNCVANKHLGDYFDHIWIMPAPGDAGSSLGAAALTYKKHINWTNAYLGHDIAGDYPVRDILNQLLHRPIVGVASGRAEFGPRALGNRSLLADPRGADIKDQVNEIKRRQKFRPFAPVILQEHVDLYFAMPRGWSDSRYMQVIANCWRPDLYPAVCHVDGTSRVQTVPQDGSGIRRLLEAWYDLTGCPMLLNTSLNIRGEPMVNDKVDAKRFENLYQVPVYTG